MPSHGAGGTRSCNDDNSSRYSGGRISLRVDSVCPNLTKVTPASSRASRSALPCRTRARALATVDWAAGRRTGNSPCLSAIRVICE